jgi:hypothetical protein
MKETKKREESKQGRYQIKDKEEARELTNEET